MAKISEDTNVTLDLKTISMIVGFTIILLGIVPALLSDKLGKRVITSFVQAVLNNGV